MKNKNFLIVTDSFYPDTTSAAQLLKDLHIKLIQKKKKVLIVCARDNYKFSKIKKKNNIINVNCGSIKNKNLIIRGYNEYFLSKYLLKKSFKKISNFKPNVIICYSPSIFFRSFVKKIQTTFKCKSYLILRDIFPYWAIDCNLIKNIFVKMYLKYTFLKFIKIFNRVGVEAKFNIKFLRKKIKEIYIEHLPNWIDIKNNVSNKKKINNSFIFSGNIGYGQDYKKVLRFYEKISLFKNNYSINILGQKRLKSSILDISQNYNIRNLKIFNHKKYNSFLKFLSQYQYGIISLNDEIKTVNFPGRLLTYLLCKMPIILLTNKKNELSEFITKHEIGCVVGEKTNIKNCLEDLAKIKKKFDKNNHNIIILKNYFNLEKNIEKIIKW